MRGKFNPVTTTTGGVTTPVAAVQFPGFQEIFDFTSAGGEASVTATVASDTDKEYIIYQYGVEATNLQVRFNADTGNNYGFQDIENNSGTISAARGATSKIYGRLASGKAGGFIHIIAPTGLIKTAFSMDCGYTSGTTMGSFYIVGGSWNNTAQITAITILPGTGTFSAGSRIVIYARRSQS
jgi:hypothetical protein